jgi:hypothetical protein
MSEPLYRERTYRDLFPGKKRAFFRIAVKETDLWVHTHPPLETLTRELILKHRGYLEAYIEQNPEFVKTLEPWQGKGPFLPIVRDMVEAAGKCGVGPMAAVAGAVAERVGRDLLPHSPEVIIENGGDVFIKTHDPLTIGIFAGRSPFSLAIGLKIDPGPKPLAVCTSSGTVGHSLSLGKADAVCVVSDDCALADAAATAIGNQVKSRGRIPQAIEFGRRIQGLTGFVIIIGDKIGAWGNLELTPIGS